MTSRLARSALFLLALAAISCDRGEPATSSAPPPATASHEPESCRPCHAAEVEAFEKSAHRLASRRIDDAIPPKARFAADALIEEAARAEGSVVTGAPPRLHVADAAGASEARTITHVLGGQRREDFLATLPDGEHVLPLAWSVTRERWVSPVSEELGASLQTGSPLWWTTPRRVHATACARCHPLPRGESPSGVACASCHGDATAHVAAKRGTDAAPWATGLRRLDASNGFGCGACHATGVVRPMSNATTTEAPLTDYLLPRMLIAPTGADPSFHLDGRPAIAHGLEAQALAQSPCAIRGGASCITCHDPHGAGGGALRDPDPDASCRNCHAAIAQQAEAHAHHPAPAAPVPLASAEPAGPARVDAPGARVPGCVDCHAPATVVFASGDTARDHAIGVPSPQAAAELGVPDACMACHANEEPATIARRFEAWWPGSDDAPRLKRARAFTRALRGHDDIEGTRGALAEVLEDSSAGPWMQASAANALSRLGESPASAAAAERALATATDPVLAGAAATAVITSGGNAQPLRDRLRVEKDWRVRLSLGSALAQRDDQQGLAALEAMHSSTTLPDIARADAAVELATVLIGRRSCQRAESLLGAALATDPLGVAAWLNMGVARACLGDVAGAREAFLRVLELSPGHVLARANLATLEQSQSGVP